MTATARKADQLDPATAQPRAHRVGIEPRELAQPAHPPPGERGLEVIAAIRLSEAEHVERQPVQEFALAARFDHAHAAASRGQMRQLLVGRDAGCRLHPDPADASHQLGGNFFFAAVDAMQAGEIDPRASRRARLDHRRNRFDRVEQGRMRRAFRGGRAMGHDQLR
jgi:hypothetical protein